MDSDEFNDVTVRLNDIIFGKDSDFQLTLDMTLELAKAYSNDSKLLDNIEVYITERSQGFQFSEDMKLLAAQVFIESAQDGTNNAAQILDEQLKQVGQE
jgi:uncharacterized protein (DUF1810 family)